MEEIVKITIYATSAILISGLLVFGVVGGIAFSKTAKGAGRSFGLLFERGNFLRILTVLFVVIAVIFLSLTGKLDEGAVAVLSGVAGYVLGGLEKQETNRKSAEENTVD